MIITTSRNSTRLNNNNNNSSPALLSLLLLFTLAWTVNARIFDQWYMSPASPILVYDEQLGFEFTYTVSTLLEVEQIQYSIYSKDCRSGQGGSMIHTQTTDTDTDTDTETTDNNGFASTSVTMLTENTHNNANNSEEQEVRVTVVIDPFTIIENTELYSVSSENEEEGNGTTTTTTAKIEFCLLFSLQTAAIEEGSTPLEVNFKESTISLTVEKTEGGDFSVSDIELVQKEKDSEEVRRAYSSRAYLCNPLDGSDMTESSTFTTTITQGRVIHICIKPDEWAQEDGLRMNSIHSLVYERKDTDNDSVTTTTQQIAIKNGIPSSDGLTDYDSINCYENELYCVVSTLLYAVFFDSSGSVSGRGEASLKFMGTRSKRSLQQQQQQQQQAPPTPTTTTTTTVEDDDSTYNDDDSDATTTVTPFEIQLFDVVRFVDDQGVVSFTPIFTTPDGAQRLYTTIAYVCNPRDGSPKNTVAGATYYFTQGNVIDICIKPDPLAQQDGVVMNAIQALSFERKYYDTRNKNHLLISQTSIENGRPASLNGMVMYTPTQCSGQEFCTVSVILSASFFETPGLVIGQGEASLLLTVVVPPPPVSRSRRQQRQRTTTTITTNEQQERDHDRHRHRHHDRDRDDEKSLSFDRDHEDSGLRLGFESDSNLLSSLLHKNNKLIQRNRKSGLLLPPSVSVSSSSTLASSSVTSIHNRTEDLVNHHHHHRHRHRRSLQATTTTTTTSFGMEIDVVPVGDTHAYTTVSAAVVVVAAVSKGTSIQMIVTTVVVSMLLFVVAG